MFVTLIVVTFFVSLLTALAVVAGFSKPITRILQRIVAEDMASAWTHYVRFAAMVVGVSGGVRIWDLEKYITPSENNPQAIELTNDRWILELYRTLIGTLESMAWMLLVFFIFALIAYVVARGMELRRGGDAGPAR